MTDAPTLPPAADAADESIPEDLRPAPLEASELAAMEAHLAAIGVQRFDGPEGARLFHAFVQDLLGQPRCQAIEELRLRRGAEGTARYVDDVAWYEYFGDPDTARALQSTRYDYFLQTGPRVLKHLPTEGRIVDLGCTTGVLTNWYAAQLPEAKVFGYDRVPAPLKVARKDAIALGLSNVKYDSADALRLIPERNIDALVSTTAFWRGILMDARQKRAYDQLTTTGERARFLQGSQPMRYNAGIIHTIMKTVRPGGTVVLMERLPDSMNAEALRILLTLAGLEERAFETVIARDNGLRQAFGMLVLERGDPPTPPESSAATETEAETEVESA